jgi:Holliday junction resolvase-like predicted endonuclease
MADWHPEQKADWDEYRVVQAFCRWLEPQGWATEIEVDHVDVVAKRGDEVLFAEVKGNTKSRPGFGVDSMYGQLLRRMAAAGAMSGSRDARVDAA